MDEPRVLIRIKRRRADEPVAALVVPDLKRRCLEVQTTSGESQASGANLCVFKHVETLPEEVKDMPHIAVPNRSTEPGRRPGRPNHENMAEAVKEQRKFQLEQMSKAARFKEVARRRFDDTEVIDLEIAAESTIMCNGVVMEETDNEEFEWDVYDITEDQDELDFDPEYHGFVELADGTFGHLDAYGGDLDSIHGSDSEQSVDYPSTMNETDSENGFY